MKRLIIAIILIQLALCNWEIRLKSKEIEFTGQKYSYDKVHYIEIDQGRGNSAIQGKVVLDTTIDKNWIRTSTCSTATCIKDNEFKCNDDTNCKVKTKIEDLNTYDFDSFGSRANFVKATLGQLTYTLEDREFTNEPVYFPTDVKASQDTPVLSHFQGGIGLGRSFVNFVADVANKMRLEKRGFSFYFTPQESSIIFGKENSFLASEPFWTFQNSEYDLANGFQRTANNGWGLTVSSLNFGKTNNYDDNIGLDAKKLHAVFDSTTRYVWAPQSIVDKFTSVLTSTLQNKCNLNPNTKVLECNCEGNYPDILIAFSDHAEKQFRFRKQQYLQRFDEKADLCQFMIRGPFNFFTVPGACTTDCTVPSFIKNPAASTLPADENYLFLGTSFLESVYTYFDNEFNVIKMAQAFVPPHQPKALNETHRYLFIILGGLLALGSLFLLFNVLKGMMQKPSQNVALQQQNLSQQQLNTQQKPVNSSQYIIQAMPQNIPYGYQPQPFQQIRPTYIIQ